MFDRYLSNLAIVRVTVHELDLLAFAHKRTVLNKSAAQIGKAGTSLWTALANTTEVALTWAWQISDGGLTLIDSSKVQSTLMLVASDGTILPHGQTLAYELAKIGSLAWQKPILDLLKAKRI
jgi:hypothetical protein